MQPSWKYTLAVDMPVGQDWEFARLLGERVGESFRVVAVDGRIHVPRMKRIANYFAVALRLFLHRGEMECLVSWQQFFGLTFAWLCSLFRVRRRTRVVVMTFIYRPKNGLPGKVYRRWVRNILRSGYVDRAVVYSRHEAEHYSEMLGVDRSLFVFAPLSVTMPELAAADGGFIFSTGSSNRDYDLLFAAVNGTAHRTVVACDGLAQPNMNNVEVCHGTFGLDMLRLMSQASIVVVTTDNPDVSSGQLTALQAMALGKPVVANRSAALADYIVDEENGLVVDRDAAALRGAIDRLMADPALRRRLGEAGRRRFAERHTTGQLAEAVAAQCR